MTESSARGVGQPVLVALGFALAAPVAVVWLTGQLAGEFASGHPVSLSPAATSEVLAHLPSHLSHPQVAWPAAQRHLLPGRFALDVVLATCTITVLALLSAASLLHARLTRRGRHAHAADWASGGQLRDLRVREAQPGRVTMGRHERHLVAAEPRASVMVVGPSQSGKTSGLVIPALLEWAGPALCTSIKSDVVHETYAARTQRGEVRIFDPTNSSGLPHSAWSPIAASRSWQGARRTAAQLLGVGAHGSARSADEAFWRPAGARYLAPMLLAAAHGDLTMRDVLAWIATVNEDEPTDLLTGCPVNGAQPALDALRSVWQSDDRFRSSLLQTVATALDPWQEPQIAAATIGDSQITPGWLLDGPNTLYLVAPAHDQRRLQGLFTALLADITAAAFQRSANTGRPIEPALLLALDEAANIAPLPDLDEIASTGPGQGVQLLTVLQNISQASDRWGSDRAQTVMANHRARVFCPAIADQATLDYLRHTLGDQEITRVATHRQGPLRPGSRTISSEFRSLAAPDRVRQADRDSALLIYGRLAPAWIKLRPWYQHSGLRKLAGGQPAPGRAATRARRLIVAAFTDAALALRGER